MGPSELPCRKQATVGVHTKFKAEPDPAITIHAVKAILQICLTSIYQQPRKTSVPLLQNGGMP